MSDELPIDRSGSIALVLTTVADVEQGERLVQQLVEERLIACGNLIPGVLSIYRWKEELAREGEVLVMMKVDSARVPELFEQVRKLHPYEVPEWVELSVAGVSGAYCRWVLDSTKRLA